MPLARSHGRNEAVALTDVINLRTARKAKARANSAVKAAGNRASFGRTKAQKQRDVAEADRRQRALDGARLGDEPKGC